MTTSTAPAVAESVTRLVTDALGPSEVRVLNGRPPDAEGARKRELVFVDDIVGSHDIATMKSGRNPRDERYTVNIAIAVIGTRGTVAKARARAFELMGVVENVVADNKTLDVEGVLSAKVGEWRTNAFHSNEGPNAEIVVGVDIHARLV
ncbi:MAG TPA: hypothetical protein VF728_08325 [Nocardioides sp.]